MKSKFTINVAASIIGALILSSCSTSQSGFLVSTIQPMPSLDRDAKELGDMRVRHDGYYFSTIPRGPDVNSGLTRSVLRFYKCGRVIFLAGKDQPELFESFLESPTSRKDARAKGLTVWVGSYGYEAGDLVYYLYMPEGNLFTLLLLRSGAYSRSTLEIVSPDVLRTQERRDMYKFVRFDDGGFTPTW